MVAYSFDPRFVSAIRAGTKRQTIRLPRRRHVRPGEEMQLYTGMRTRHCALITRVTCAGVLPLSLVLGGNGIEQITVAAMPVTDLEAFAGADGFADLRQMSTFWGLAHGEGSFADLVLIRW